MTLVKDGNVPCDCKTPPESSSGTVDGVTTWTNDCPVCGARWYTYDGDDYTTHPWDNSED